MTYLVAELGQNHQGSRRLALDLVDAVARPYDAERDKVLSHSWDAVKTCKRDLGRELSRSEETRPYEGRRSFGDTYLEHRRALELSWDDHAQVRDRAKSHGLDFIITLCAPTLVAEMPFTPDAVKVASRDLTNVPLLEAIARLDVPVILSTGMHGPDAVDRALEIVGTESTTVLHCLSQYPADPDHVHLRTLKALRSRYPSVRVGYSDHTVGLLAGPLAVALGAETIEAHVTLWRGMAGSDHRGALGPEGVWRYARDVRLAERMLGEARVRAEGAADSARRKLERSLAIAEDAGPGTLVGSSNVVMVSPGTGLSWEDRDRVFGKTLTTSVQRHELLSTSVVAPSS